MELKLLRAFVSVAEQRHFGHAADHLCVSQPALSKQIVALESSLGARLFVRGRHGAELTGFGEAFLADATALIRDADEVLARAREAANGKRGALRIGLGLSTLDFAPPLIAEFRRLNPNVAVTLNGAAFLPSRVQSLLRDARRHTATRCRGTLARRTRMGAHARRSGERTFRRVRALRGEIDGSRHDEHVTAHNGNRLLQQRKTA